MPDLPREDTLDPTARRAAAEASGDDRALLHWHELDVAIAGLPPVIDGARRGRLVHVDPLATTWEAWDVQDGTRLLVRCIRPRWKDDPVMLRRMARGARGPRPPEWRDGEWPHLRAVLSGTPLRDRLPVEDAPSTSFLARVLGSGLDSLREFHERGLVHGGPMLDTLIENDDGALALVYLDPFPSNPSEGDDLRELARAVTALDPTGDDPITRLADAWCETPPPSAEDGLRLVAKALAGDLLEIRHRLALVRRHTQRRGRVARLSRATTALWSAISPPRGTWCVRAGPGALLVVITCDGKQVRGGTAATADARFLPPVFDPERGLDAQKSRFLLRAWAARKQEGNEEERLRIQTQLGSDDEALTRLLRWLGNMARLRTARLLLRDSA
jgi:hypothetical protein